MLNWLIEKVWDADGQMTQISLDFFFIKVYLFFKKYDQIFSSRDIADLSLWYILGLRIQKINFIPRFILEILDF